MKYFLLSNVVLLLFGCQFKKNNQILPQAENGIIDLRDWDFNQFSKVKLSGEWDFYWKEFIDPELLINQEDFCDKNTVNVPSRWSSLNDSLYTYEDEGFASFHLKILLDSPPPLNLYLNHSFSSASRVLVNNKVIGHQGMPGINLSEEIPGMYLDVSDYVINDDTVHITIHTSNFHRHLLKGGIENPIYIGLKEQFINDQYKGQIINSLLVGAYLFMIIYHIVLFLLRPQSKTALYFGLYCLVFALYFLLVKRLVYFHIQEIEFEWHLKLTRGGLFWGVAALALFEFSLFPKEFSRFLLKLILFFAAVFSFVILVFDATTHTSFLPVFQLYTLVCSLYLIIVVVLAYIRKREDAGVLLVGGGIMFLTLANDLLMYMEMLDTTLLLQFGTFTFFFSQSYVISARFSRAFFKSESLSNELGFMNQNLELLVKKRTITLEEQKAEIIKKGEEIKAQRDLERKQRDIIEIQNHQITSSILYAQKIQETILPSPQAMQEIFEDYFILYQPKDIVSGDFYWIHKSHGKIFIAVVDCTGHGVPGAFMSMIGHSILYELVEGKKLSNPAQILQLLDKEVKSRLKQKEEIGSLRDGMDLIFCVLQKFNDNGYKLEYAGAKRPIYLSINKEVIVHKGERSGIGGGSPSEEKQFSTYHAFLKRGDKMYLTTDGIFDQPNPQRKRFGRKRLLNFLNEHQSLSMKSQETELQKQLETFSDSADQRDDITVLGIEV